MWHHNTQVLPVEQAHPRTQCDITTHGCCPLNRPIPEHNVTSQHTGVARWTGPSQNTMRHGQHTGVACWTGPSQNTMWHHNTRVLPIEQAHPRTQRDITTHGCCPLNRPIPEHNATRTTHGCCPLNRPTTEHNVTSQHTGVARWTGPSQNTMWHHNTRVLPVEQAHPRTQCDITTHRCCPLNMPITEHNATRTTHGCCPLNRPTTEHNVTSQHTGVARWTGPSQNTMWHHNTRVLPVEQAHPRTQCDITTHRCCPLNRPITEHNATRTTHGCCPFNRPISEHNVASQHTGVARWTGPSQNTMWHHNTQVLPVEHAHHRTQCDTDNTRVLPVEQAHHRTQCDITTHGCCPLNRPISEHNVASQHTGVARWTGPSQNTMWHHNTQVLPIEHAHHRTQCDTDNTRVLSVEQAHHRTQCDITTHGCCPLNRPISEHNVASQHTGVARWTGPSQNTMWHHNTQVLPVEQAHHRTQCDTDNTRVLPVQQAHLRTQCGITTHGCCPLNRPIPEHNVTSQHTGVARWTCPSQNTMRHGQHTGVVRWIGPPQNTMWHHNTRVLPVEQAHLRTQCGITTHGCCPLNRPIPEHNVTSQHTGVARWTGPSQNTMRHGQHTGVARWTGPYQNTMWHNNTRVLPVEQAHPRTQCDITTHRCCPLNRPITEHNATRTTHGCCPLNRPTTEHNVTSQHTGVARWTGPSQNTMWHHNTQVLPVEQAHPRTQCDITTHGCCPLNRPIPEHNVTSQHTGVARWTGPSQNTMRHGQHTGVACWTGPSQNTMWHHNTRVLPIEQAHPRTQRDITTHGCCPLNRPIPEHNATRTTHGCCPLNRPTTEHNVTSQHTGVARWTGPSQNTMWHHNTRVLPVEQAHPRTQCDITTHRCCPLNRPITEHNATWTTHGCCPLNRPIPEHNVTSQHTGVARWTGPSQNTMRHGQHTGVARWTGPSQNTMWHHNTRVLPVEQAHPRTQCDTDNTRVLPVEQVHPRTQCDTDNTRVLPVEQAHPRTQCDTDNTRVLPVEQAHPRTQCDTDNTRVLPVEQAHPRTQCDITTHGCCPLNRPIPEHNTTRTTHGCCPLNRPTTEHNVTSQHTGVARWTGPSQNTMWHHNTRVLPVEQAHPRTQCDITTHRCCPLNRPITEHNATRTTHGCCPLNRPIPEHNVTSQHTGVARWTGPSQNTMWHHNTQVLPVEQAHHRTQCDTDNTRVLPVEQVHPRTQCDITTHGCCQLNRPISYWWLLTALKSVGQDRAHYGHHNLYCVYCIHCTIVAMIQNRY